MSVSAGSPAPDPGRSRGRRPGILDWLDQRMNLAELFSFLGHFGLLYTPVNTSRPFREVLDDVATRPVSSYMRGPRILGLLTAVLFGLEAVTGVLLACYYQPSPGTAFASTRTIVRDLPFGWFVHQTHLWGSYLLIALVALRLARLFWDGLFRAPREVLWGAAVLMCWIVVQADFTGRLLPWDMRSYWSVVRGLEVAMSQPIVGPLISFLIGGTAINADVLVRFYVFHLLILPVLFLACFYFTFATIRRVGLSPVPESEVATTKTFRDHLFSIVTLYVLVFGVLVSLAVLMPFPFTGQADPYATPQDARPPWYLLAPHLLVERSFGPRWIGGLVIVIVVTAVLLLPWWAKRVFPPGQKRKMRIVGILGLGVWALLSVAGFLLDRPR